MKRALSRLVYAYGPACFACGKRARQACPGHEYGGVITQWSARRATRLLPRWLYGWVDPRWRFHRVKPRRFT